MVMALTSPLVTTDRNNNTRIISFRISFYVFRSTFSISEVTCVSEYLQASKYRWDAHMALRWRIRESAKVQSWFSRELCLSQRSAWAEIMLGWSEKYSFVVPAGGGLGKHNGRKPLKFEIGFYWTSLRILKIQTREMKWKNLQRPEKWARKRKLPLISISFELFSSRGKSRDLGEANRLRESRVGADSAAVLVNRRQIGFVFNGNSCLKITARRRGRLRSSSHDF